MSEPSPLNALINLLPFIGGLWAVVLAVLFVKNLVLAPFKAFFNALLISAIGFIITLTCVAAVLFGLQLIRGEGFETWGTDFFESVTPEQEEVEESGENDNILD